MFILMKWTEICTFRFHSLSYENIIYVVLSREQSGFLMIKQLIWTISYFICMLIPPPSTSFLFQDFLSIFSCDHSLCMHWLNITTSHDLETSVSFLEWPKVISDYSFLTSHSAALARPFLSQLSHSLNVVFLN